MVLLVATWWSAVTDANGGRLRLGRVEAGPYLVSVWTQPDPPRVGRLDVSVAVMQPPGGGPVLDANVTVSVVRDGRDPKSAPAPRGAGGNLLLHHAEIELAAAGAWQVKVAVSGPRGTGAAEFPLTALPPSPLLRVIAAVGGATLAGWLLWRRLTRRRSQPRSRTGTGC
jgi:hypothetical protein